MIQILEEFDKNAFQFKINSNKTQYMCRGEKGNNICVKDQAQL